MAKMGGSKLGKKEANKVYLRGKEELTHTTQGKPRWDESFFKQASKEKAYRGNKY
jgi:hypothetical protein